MRTEVGASQPPVTREPIFLSDISGVCFYTLVNKIDGKSTHGILTGGTKERESPGG